MVRLLSLVAACGALLPAQDFQSRPAAVRATGEAAVSIRADQMRLRLAVVTKAGTAERAREKNAERATDLIARLREFLGQDSNIRTANYSLTSNLIDGYVANHTIEVHAKDPAISGRIIDIATKFGASVLGGVDSSALDEQDARSEALRLATAQAQTSAEAIATALGLRVVRVLSAETPTPPAAQPFAFGGLPLAGKKKANVATPVANGTIEIRAQVTITVEVAP